MNNLNRIIYISIFLIFQSCGNTAKVNKEEKTKFQNKGHEIIYNMTQHVGTYQDLLNLKDVKYIYTYTTPDGKKDVSEEKYIFDGELSSGLYRIHERTLPELEGPLHQIYDGINFILKHNNKTITDSTTLKRVQFSRKTNFYWFAMFAKMLDPGLHYEWIDETSIDGKTYDIVKVTFQTTNGVPTDIYQLYINQKTKLVDQFLFTVVDFNVVENPYLMKVKYEEINNIKIPTKRMYTKATWDGLPLSDTTWIHVDWSDITFNTGLTKESDFQ